MKHVGEGTKAKMLNTAALVRRGGLLWIRYS